MNKENQDKFFKIVGILYILLGITSIINSYLIKNSDQLYWFCYFGLLLVGVGMLTKSSKLIAAQINILGIPLLIWSIDFFYILFTNDYLLGIADYFFLPGNWLGKILSLQHIYTIPLAIYALYILKLEKKDAYKISLLQAALIFTFTILLTSPISNINCVFASCVGPLQFEQYYTLIWIVLVTTMILLTNWIITNFKSLMKK